MRKLARRRAVRQGIPRTFLLSRIVGAYKLPVSLLDMVACHRDDVKRSRKRRSPLLPNPLLQAVAEKESFTFSALNLSARGLGDGSGFEEFDDMNSQFVLFSHCASNCFNDFEGINDGSLGGQTGSGLIR